jgi:D-2-hydroxyacid dehydrogenase (NADP+)
MKRFGIFGSVSAPEVSTQTKKVIANLSAGMTRELAALAPRARIVPANGEAALTREIVDADALVGVKLTPESFHLAKKLEWLHVGSAGVEKALFPDLVMSDVVVTNMKNLYGPQIADHAFAFLLALTRKLNITIPKQQLEEWPGGRDGMYELNARTAVIIGLGGIGCQIAQRAHGFGMKVIGVDVRGLPATNIVQRVVHPHMLNSVLPEADVVFVAVPHTPKSDRMMGPRQFELMKRGSYFIAISRGKTYDQSALIQALDGRRLAGAGLDVTDPEPLPKGSPLWKFPNVIITPHTSGGSEHLQERTDDLVRENIRRFASGTPLLNVVDKMEGF